MSWCPRPFVLPCSSIRPMLRLPRPHCGTCRKPPAPSGLQIQILNASTIREIDAAFATLRASAPMPSSSLPDVFFGSRRVQFITLTARHRIPATFRPVICPQPAG